MKKHMILCKFISSLIFGILSICSSVVLSTPPKYPSIECSAISTVPYNLDFCIKQITDSSEYLKNNLFFSKNALSVIYNSVKNAGGLLDNKKSIIDKLLGVDTILKDIYIDFFSIFKIRDIDLKIPELPSISANNNNQFNNNYNLLDLGFYNVKISNPFDRLISSLKFSKDALNIINHYSQVVDLSKHCTGVINELKEANEMLNNTYKILHHIFEFYGIGLKEPQFPCDDSNNSNIVTKFSTILK